MIRELFRQQLKSFFRSASFQRELVLQFVVALLFIYLLAIAIFLAFQLPDLLGNFNGNVIALLHKILFYYFVAELLIRYFIQSSPALDLEPYLHLPIGRGKMSFYLQVKSVIHPINFLSALLTGPFAFTIVAPEYGLGAAWIWWLSIIFCSFTLHFIMLLFRRKWEDNILSWVFLLIVTVINYLLSYYGVFDLSLVVSAFFEAVLSISLVGAAPLLLMGIVGYYSYKYHKENLNLENTGSEKNAAGESYSSKFSFLNSYGINGALILQEIRLILRHKRSRSFLILSLIFLFYGLIFLNDYEGGFQGILIFLGVFISGIFTFNYGQLLWGWKTNLLDFYFTRPFELKTIVTALYRFLATSCLIFGLLSIPYVYFGWEVLLVYMACMIFNMGINVPLVIALAMWKPSAMDINKTAFMNYQGVGPAQWLMMVPVMGLPFAIYFLVSWISNDLVAILILGLIGLMAILCADWIIGLLTRRLRKNRYILIKSLNL